MGMIQIQYRTVTCDAPSCKNTVTFEQRQDNRGIVEAMEKHPWIKTVREVQASGRQFLFCSDACELESVAAGNHNPVERKTIVLPEGANAMAAAEAQAKIQEAADKAIKTGSGIQVVR